MSLRALIKRSSFFVCLEFAGILVWTPLLSTNFDH
jgi:hypothetical protein